MGPVGTQPGDEGQFPRDEYARRLDARRHEVTRQERRESWVANVRVVVFLTGPLILWMAMGPKLLHLAWLAVPAGGFVVLVVLHERLRREHRRAKRAVAFYERGMARLENRWAGGGEPGDRFADPNHPYERDLDIFGKGSLFELLSIARTQGGEQTLAAWLLGPASPSVVRSRQGAVQELRSRLDLREDLAVMGLDVRAEVRSDALAAWGQEPPVLRGLEIRIVATVLAFCAAVTLVGWGFFEMGRLPFVGVVTLELALMLAVRHRVKPVTGAADGFMNDIVVLAQVLVRLEHERFEDARLCGLQGELFADGVPASRQIAGLVRLLDLLRSRRNQFFAPFAFVLLWEIQLAFAIEAWRAKSGRAIAGWLRSVADMEALSSLAGYSYEHPRDPFPEILETGPLLDAKGLGHPLLSEDVCVRNDVYLGSDLRLLVVSGSNMSGKSTLLRTVGVNVVFALAGAPVRARQLRLSPLAVGATLRIQDSLATGTSRFYAEITRLRQLMDLAVGQPPLLFLLDELLQGTNSHDRRIGAEAVVREFIERGGIGLVTTHDLALAEIAESLTPRATNVHFEDLLQNGRMSFDYRIRPGVVRRSNALELMRAVGIKL